MLLLYLRFKKIALLLLKVIVDSGLENFKEKHILWKILRIFFQIITRLA